MPTAWIVTQAKPEWIESFSAAGWEVKLFAPAGLAPAGPAPDPDVIIYDAEERPLSNAFRMICQEKFVPLLAIVADWALAWEAIETGADDVIVAPVDPNGALIRAQTGSRGERRPRGRAGD